MVRSNKLSRDEAIKILSNKPILNDEKHLKDYILDKLDISDNEFNKILQDKNRNFKNFKTYYNYFKNFKFIAKFLFKLGIIPKNIIFKILW